MSDEYQEVTPEQTKNDEMQTDSVYEDAQPAENGSETTPQPSMDVWGVLQYCFILLHSQAWQAMGLVPDPASRTIKRDLDQARVAIDTASYIVTQLEPKLESKEQRNLRAMLSDLQINFVNQQKMG
jgi:hypothetical protein